MTEQTDQIENPYEPSHWLLVFETSTTRPWLDWLVPGRFKHVWALGYVPHTELWIFYNVTFGRTTITPIPDSHAALAVVDRFTAGKTVLRVEVKRAAPHIFGFWCVPAIKHLIGLRSGALLVDGLYHHCLAAGAEIYSDELRHAIIPAEPAGTPRAA